MAKSEDLNDIEKRARETQIGISNLLYKGEWDLSIHKNSLNDPKIFPNEMSDVIAEKLPPTVIFTSEFDIFRFAAEELAGKLKKNGVLLDYCCQPGTIHGWYFDFNSSKADLFWNDQAIVFKKWLIGDKDDQRLSHQELRSLRTLDGYIPHDLRLSEKGSISSPM